MKRTIAPHEGAPMAEPARFAGLPVLVVAGTHDLEHPHETDLAIVDWLTAAGARAEFHWLATAAWSATAT